MHKVILVLMLFLPILNCCTGPKEVRKDTDDFVISFGSCSHQWDEQPIWTSVIATEPDLWIWLGDIIYADTRNMSKMEEMYQRQKQRIEYQALLEATDVIGVWDDHDYGANNAGKEYPKKDSSATLLLDFLEVSADHPSRERSGVYQSYTFGEAGQEIKVILLDVRYFRDEPGVDGGTVLGEEQWLWLAEELTNSTANVHIIGGGYQFLPVDHRYEKWANFPGEKERLLKLLDSLSVNTPVLISGDRHFGEMMKEELPGGGVVYEVTSSGLTHSYEELTDEPNRFRIGPFTNERNFGLLRIDWDTKKIVLEVRNEENEVVISEGFGI